MQQPGISSKNIAKTQYFDRYDVKEKGIRLFCFPYAGGGASVFRLWQEKLGDDIHVYPAHYPGHEERIMEKPVKDMNTLVTSLFEEMNKGIQHPFVLFGHSAGSRVAYELAVQFEEAKQKNLRGIIVSGGLAPNRREVNPIYQLAEENFFNSLSQYGRTPRELFENKDLWAIFGPVLRADFTLADTYQDEKYRKIHVPVLALRGTKDPEISKADLQEWKHYTTAEFRHKDIEGEHLFIDTNTDEVLDVIKEHIMQVLLPDLSLRLER